MFDGWQVARLRALFLGSLVLSVLAVEKIVLEPRREQTEIVAKVARAAREHFRREGTYTSALTTSFSPDLANDAWRYSVDVDVSNDGTRAAVVRNGEVIERLDASK